jgi:hypothetical protein
MLWRYLLGVNFRPSTRFSLYVAAGALVASSRNSSAVQPNLVPTILLPSGADNLSSVTAFQPAVFLPGAGTTSSTSGSAADWLANVRATYFLDSTTQFTVVAAQSVSPDSFGNIFKTDSVGVALSRQVNYSESLYFAADAVRLTSIGTVSEFYTASTRAPMRSAPPTHTAFSWAFGGMSRLYLEC